MEEGAATAAVEAVVAEPVWAGLAMEAEEAAAWAAAEAAARAAAATAGVAVAAEAAAAGSYPTCSGHMAVAQWAHSPLSQVKALRPAHRGMRM